MEKNEEWFPFFCTKAFGVDGFVSKSFAEKKGNAIFAAFMEELNKVPDSNNHKAFIVKRAKARRYHDYEGDLCKIGLVSDLFAAGLDDLANRVKMGDFDF